MKTAISICLTFSLIAVLFFTTKNEKPGLQPATEDMADISEEWETHQALVREEWFTLPKEELRLFMVAGLSDPELRREILQRVEKKTASQDRFMLLRSRSGQRAKVEQIDEFPYPTDFDPGQLSSQITILDAASVAAAMKLPAPLAPVAPENPSPPKRPGNSINGGFGMQSTITGTTFTVRNLGDTLEIDPVIREGNKIVELFIKSECVHFMGNVDYGGVTQPRFQTQKIDGHLTTLSGQPILAGTCSKASGTSQELDNECDDAVTVSFITVNVTRLMPAVGVDPFASAPSAAEPSPLDPFASPTNSPPQQTPPPQDELFAANKPSMRLQFEMISLPTAAASALIDEHLDDRATRDRLLSMIAQDTAQLEKLISLRTLSYNRARVEQIAEMPYATDFDPPQLPQILTIADPIMEEVMRQGGSLATEAANRPPLDPPNAGFGFITRLSPTTYTVRNVGESVEVDPVLGEDGVTADLNIAPESVRFIGEVAFAESIQPVFETQKLNTAVTSHIGQPCLLGTMSRPYRTGAPGGNETDRVWLAFVTPFLD